MLCCMQTQFISCQWVCEQLGLRTDFSVGRLVEVWRFTRNSRILLQDQTTYLDFYSSAQCQF